MEDDRVALGRVMTSCGDLVVRRREAVLIWRLIDGLRVVRLDHRLHVDDVGFGDHLVDVVDDPVVGALVVELFEELGEGSHLLGGEDDHSASNWLRA